MTKEVIEKQLSVYSKEYDVSNAVQNIQDAIEDAGLELGNIICLFNYKRDTYLEVNPFTQPGSNIKLKFDKI